MTLCDDGHDEVCFESRNCPVCAVMEERDKIQERLDDAKAEIEALEKGE